MVNTVLGPVPVSELGVTLMHEHIVNIEWNIARNFPEYYDKESVVEMFCQEAEQLKAYGVRTWVDPTPITLGRDVSLLRECAERSGLNIIACTYVSGTNSVLSASLEMIRARVGVTTLPIQSLR